MVMGERADRRPAPPGTVVVPLDGSRPAEAALRLGELLAARFRATVQTVTVGAAAPQADVALDGDPVAALLDHLSNVERPVVCMASHGRGGVRRRLVGSVAEGLVRRSTVPVLVRGPRARAPERMPVRTILVGVAWSPHLQRLLATVGGWAPLLGAGVELVHVRYPTAAELYTARVAGHLPPDQPALETLAGELLAHGVQSSSHVLAGSDPVDALLARAGHLPPPVLLAVDTHDAGAATHHDIAYQLIRRSPWPILATSGR
jgi:nucleotide-binding universal stress UspA family protein